MPEEIPPTLFRSPKRSQNSTEINPALTSQNPTLSKTSKAPTQLPTRKRYKMRLFFCWGIFAALTTRADWSGSFPRNWKAAELRNLLVNNETDKF